MDKAYRDFLKDVLENDSNIKLIGGYDTASSFLKSLNSPFKPNVCLFDLVLPDSSGIECCRVIREKSPQTAIIILTAYPEYKSIEEAKALGAEYIEKGTVK